MAQPTPYVRATDFSSEEASAVGGRSTVRTAALDAELDALGLTANETRVNIGLIQRDDGKVKDGVVELHTLAGDTRALLAAGQGLPRGAWLTATAYALRDIVTQSGNSYICAVAHTSGTFATDLAANRWMILSLGAAPLASSVPVTPTGGLASTNVQAALEELQTEVTTASGLAVSEAAAVASSLSASGGSALVGFVQAGTGAATRTVQAKLRDVIANPDFTTLAGSVADVNTNGGELFFPRGAVVSSVSVPNLHAVPKVGRGSITRGSDTFLIRPRRSQTNRIYVNATTGLAANDGLSASEPVQTLAQAFAILAEYGPMLSGTWRIVLAAGTYTGLADFPESLRGDFRVVIEGPIVNHPNVPTAIIDGVAAQAYGINLAGGAQRVLVSNVLVRNFTAYGIVGQDLCDITTVNVHSSGITSGADAAAIKVQQGRLRVQGGIITGCRHGVIAIGATVFTIGDGAGSLAAGPQITGCTQAGVLAQDGATGHTDYVTIDNCAVGVDAATNAKVNVIGCDVKNNATAGIRASSGAQVLADPSTVYSGNGIDEVIRSKGGEIDRQVAWVDRARAAVDTSVASHTGTTSATNIRTFAAALKNASFVWAGRSLELEASGGLSGTAGTKTLALRIGTTDVVSAVIPAASTGGFKVLARLQAVDATNQRARIEVYVNNATPLIVVANGAVNMAPGSAQDVHLRCTLASAADTVQPTLVELWQTA